MAFQQLLSLEFQSESMDVNYVLLKFFNDDFIKIEISWQLLSPTLRRWLIFDGEY